ncbi:MAG TPA: hypothetical protein VMZ31_10645 [Phycisphaerae bacterium]|nr:hypothetical protein [Phycisphaerae bacterium]
MENTPSQQEVDALAHFVETARELQQSPFFIEEYQSLALSTHWPDPERHIKARFPDEHLVKGMLVPFRRLWQKAEPSHYLRVANILKRHIPQWRGLVDSLLINDRASMLRRLPWFKGITLPLADVIDVWLNTKYMHVGESVRCGRFDRRDFERLQQEIGAVRFEAFFLWAVQEVGICFFNLMLRAAPFLGELKKQGIVPSFTFDGREPAPSSVERSTPGYTPDKNSPAQRVWRLRRRWQYDAWNRFLALVEYADDLAAQVTRRCETFDAFVYESHIHLEYSEDLSALDSDDFTGSVSGIDNHPTAVNRGLARTGWAGKRRDGIIVWTGDYVPILHDQYLEFREALLREPFV